MRSGKYYAAVIIDGKKVDKHRLVAEQKLGRKLHRNEIVHHINGDIQDNRPENLEVMTREEHGRLHGVGRMPSDETRRKCSEAKLGKPREDLRSLSPEQMMDAQQMMELGFSARATAECFGVSHTTILRCMKKYIGANKKLPTQAIGE